ncbi:MAG: FAD-binding oxidoreductase, partial [Mycetocola sp.]
MTLSDTDVAELRAALSGDVLEPDDPHFAAEVAAQNTLIVHTPQLAVIPHSEADVRAAVRFAAGRGLAVRVQATGHGAEAPITDGLLILTKRMLDLSVDPDTHIATIGAGVRWEAVIAAASEHGLAPITGSSTHVGAIGYTLGGGLGPLARSHGFTSDWVRGFRVVLADGRVVTADTDEHPDLFWALRGGKGGLGVVTEMRVELVPIRTLYAGSLFFDGPDVEAALRAWTDWLPTAPSAATTSVALMNMPPIDEIPEPFRGRFLLSLRFAWVGDPAEGERILAPLRAAAPVYIDGVAEIPATEVGTIHGDPSEPGPVWTRGILLKPIDQDFVDELLAHFGREAGAPFAGVEVRHLGGATAVDVAGGSAAGGRRSAHTLTMIGVAPPLFERMPVAAEAFLAAAARWVSPETNINFAGNVTDAERFASAWPGDAYERLSKTRAQYDPDRVFA